MKKWAWTFVIWILLSGLSQANPDQYHYQNPPGWEDALHFTHQSWDFRTDAVPLEPDTESQTTQNPYGTPRLYKAEDPLLGGWSPDAMGYNTLESDNTEFSGFHGGMGTAMLAFAVPGPSTEPPPGQARKAWVQYIVYATQNATGDMDTRFYTDQSLDKAMQVATSHRISRTVENLGKAGGSGHYFLTTEIWVLPQGAQYFRIETVGGVTMVESVHIDTCQDLIPEEALDLYSHGSTPSGTPQAMKFMEAGFSEKPSPPSDAGPNTGPMPGPPPGDDYTYNGYQNPPNWSEKTGFTHQSWDFRYAGVTEDGNTYIAPAPYTADADQPGNPENTFGDPRLLATAAPTAMTGWGPDAMGFDTLDSDGTVFHGFYGGMGTTWIKLHIPGPDSLPEDQIRNAWVQYIVYATNNETGEMDAGFHTDESLSESSRLPDSHRLSREIDDLGTAGGTGHYFRVTELWTLPADANYFRLETVGGVTMIDSVDIDTCQDVDLASAITVSPESGTFFDDTLEVNLTASTLPEGVVIRFTTDGTDPTGSSDVFTAAISLTQTTALKYGLFEDTTRLSEIRTAMYYKGSTGPKPGPPPG